MKFIDKKSVRRYQQGGPVGQPMPAEGAPAPQGGQDQMMAQIEQIAVSLIQELGPDGAAMLAETIMAILQSQSAPVGDSGAPVFRQGGKLLRRVK